MDRNYIDRYLVIDRYLAGDLVESEATDFEERIVWDKELIEELDLAVKLRDGLRASAEEASLGKITAASPPRRAATFTRMAIAASFAVGALTTSLFFSQQTIMVADNNIPTSVVSLNLLRGNAEQQIAIKPGAMIVLMVAADEGHSGYRVAVSKRDDPEIIWAQSGFTPGYTESLAVGINGGLLRPGNYVLIVYAVVDDADTLIRDIPFRAVLSE
jgi:hypothetical protein